MLMNEVCKKCCLTKKAVMYYMEQGLVSPAIQENGYRDFSQEDVMRLQKISVLRNLGLSVAEIQKFLSHQEENVLNEIVQKKALEVTVLQEKQQLIEELDKTGDWQEIQKKLLGLQKKQSIMERLRTTFPGYYGNYICVHFAPYLNEPVLTKKQQEAFDTILSFLDNVSFQIPKDLQQEYQEFATTVDNNAMKKISDSFRSAVYDMETYLEENKKVIEDYMKYTQTAEYKETSAFRMMQSLRQFQNECGYQDIFIPAMCQLSNSYREYYEALQKANEVFLRRYPDGQNRLLNDKKDK